MNVTSREFESYLREELVNCIPDYLLTRVFRSLSIDFIRELDQHIDLKQFLWTIKPWSVTESIEEHMERHFPHLREFWKDIITDKRYKEHGMK